MNSDHGVEEKSEISWDIREDLSLLKDLLNQTRTEVTRMRQRFDRRQSEIDAHMRRARIFWVVTLLAVAGLGAAFWYFRQSPRSNADALTVRLPAMQALADAGQERLSTLEGRLNSSIQVTDSIQTRVVALEQSQSQSQSKTPDARKAEQTLPSGSNSGVRSNGAAIDGQRAQTNLSAGQKLSSRDVSGVQLQSDSVNRNRIAFKVPRNKTEEVAPGIFLTVRTIDVERQRIEGWFQIAEDGRTVWFRDQGAQKVLSFTTKHDSRSRELIFTHIDKNGASGFLLIPTGSG